MAPLIMLASLARQVEVMVVGMVVNSMALQVEVMVAGMVVNSLALQVEVMVAGILNPMALQAEDINLVIILCNSNSLPQCPCPHPTVPRLICNLISQCLILQWLISPCLRFRCPRCLLTLGCNPTVACPLVARLCMAFQIHQIKQPSRWRNARCPFRYLQTFLKHQRLTYHPSPSPPSCLLSLPKVSGSTHSCTQACLAI